MSAENPTHFLPYAIPTVEHGGILLWGSFSSAGDREIGSIQKRKRSMDLRVNKERNMKHVESKIISSQQNNDNKHRARARIVVQMKAYSSLIFASSEF